MPRPCGHANKQPPEVVAQKQWGDVAFLVEQIAVIEQAKKRSGFLTPREEASLDDYRYRLFRTGVAS